jgi:hypothetical protein
MKFRIDRDASFDGRFGHGDRLRGPCNPTIEDGLGIAINAPRRVLFSAAATLEPHDAPFIVCGAVTFIHDTFGWGADFADRVSFVAVDARTHQAYAARIPPNVAHPARPLLDAPLPERSRTGETLGEVFRANLAGLMQLPADETEYIVYAAAGPFRSNALMVMVRRRPEGR